jgi:hypothetical protein
MIAVIIGAVVVVVGAIGFMISRGGSRQEPGVVSFRKHIDALSPEARREVMDRVRPQPQQPQQQPQPPQQPKPEPSDPNDGPED